jgi:Uma2 family endonuclease
MIPSSFLTESVHRFTIDEYERIILAGALKDPNRVELLNGYVLDKLAKSPQHGYSIRKLFDRLGDLIGPGLTRRAEQPIRISDYDEPEPDVAVVRGSTEDYTYRVPRPDDAALLVEVSLITLDQDRGEKQMAYARGRIPAYWIVNLVERQIEVFSDPGSDGYGTSQIYPEGQSVPVVINGMVLGEIAVSDILPPAVVQKTSPNWA